MIIVNNRELRLDAARERRTGIAEAVFAPGKTPQQCADAVAGLLATTAGPVVLTRATPAQVRTAQVRATQVRATQVRAMQAIADEATVTETGPHLTVTWRKAPSRVGVVALVTAGTADLPVAREAEAVLSAYGIGTDLVADAGVAGLHRIIDQTAALKSADVVIVVAGMEGALASVVAGLTAAPVVAVPTSVGYGAALAGITALLAMLASCSPGITVVGIDNGFGAACAALRILNRDRLDGPLE